MTENFLKKPASEIFWLSIFLGLPLLIWLYAIPTELNKRIPQEARINKLIYQLPFFYAIAYIPGFILLFITDVSFNTIKLFHFTAMGAIFFLLIIACISTIRFEKFNNIKTSNGVLLFFGIWFYIFGIWSIQPKMNKYINSKIIQH